MLRRWTLGFFAVALAMFIGWVGGSAFPLPLWDYSDCHRLGGGIEIGGGPGKPLNCVIPLTDASQNRLAPGPLGNSR
jgi:hypothetical protein